MLYSIEIDASDREFMEELFCKMYPLMKKTASRMAGGKDAEDIVMAACVKLMKYIETLRGLESKARIAYVAMAVRSAAIDHLKSKNKITEKELHTEVDIASSKEPGFEKVENKDLLRVILKRLSQRDQDMLYCFYYLDMSHKEIGKFFDIPVSHVGGYLAHARKVALSIYHREEGRRNER